MRTERDGGEFLKATWLKWHKFVENVRLGKKTRIFLPHCQTAVVINISAETLRKSPGAHFGIEIWDEGEWFIFSPYLRFTREAYQQASRLMQLSLQGRAEDYWCQLETKQPDLAESLQEVPGFSDLVESVISGGTPEQPAETVFQHLRLASWFASLSPGQQERLIPPEQIFTQPG